MLEFGSCINIIQHENGQIKRICLSMMQPFKIKLSMFPLCVVGFIVSTFYIRWIDYIMQI